MAAATNTARGAPMEEENLTPKIEEKDPPNKSEVTMTTTTGQAFAMPLEDKKSTMVEEEVPMIVKVAEKGAEVAKKGVASGKYKEEDEELERKDRGHVGLEDTNGEEEGGRGGDDHMKVEEAKTDGKVHILGVVEAMKNDDGGEITKDIEFFGSMVEASVMLEVEKEKDNSQLGDGTNFLASHDEVEGEDKSELLKEEQQKEESGFTVKAKVEGDVESIVVEEEKPEPKGQKGEDVGFGGRDGGNFIEEKVTKASSVRIEVVELDVNVSPFPKAKDALGYDKEASNDAMVVGGEEIPKESIGNDTNIEYETTKSEQGNKTGTMAMNDGSVDEVAQEKTDSVLDYCPTQKDVDGQVIASEAEDEVGVASEVEVAYKVLDDVESTMINKEKQKQEGEKNEEVCSLGGDDGELKGKDVEVLVLSVEAIEMEDKLAPLAETSEKFSYAMQGSNNIVDVNEGSVPEVTLGSAYHMPKDISKEYNAEGQATASETEEEVHVVLEMSDVEKVENDERYLLDKDVKPKLESVKSEDIAFGGSDGGKLDEEKEAKVSVASMFVESQVGAMVVNGRIIDGVDLACEDSMLTGSSEKNRNTEDQTTENELKKEVHVVLESNVTYKVSDDIEFDMAEDEKGEPEGEKSEEMESVGGNGGKLDRGKDIKVFTDSVEVIELEDKLVPLAETNEKFGYVKEGSDDAVHVNEGNAYEVTPASAYSMLEDISKKEHSVDSQATSSEADKVGVVVEIYVADKLPIDAKSLLAKGEEGGSGGRDGSELNEEKEAEVSIVTTMFVEPEADAMVVNDRIIGEFSLASEDTMLVGSPKKKQNFEGRTTSNEMKEEVHVVGDSSMDGEKKAKAEGKNSEDIGFVSGIGSKLGEEKDVEVFPITIEDTELEQKLAHLGETNENFGYAEERSDDLVDVNKGSVEVVIPASTCSLPEGISKKKHNVEGQATTSEAEEELGVGMDMYVPDKMSDDAKTLLAKEEKPILKGIENEEVGSGAWDGVEFDEEKEAKVSIPSIVFVEPEASAIVVINKNIDEVDLPCEDSVSVGCLENKQSAKGQITKIEVKEEVHVVVEPEVKDKVPDDIESNMDDEEKPKPECDKGEEIGSICGNVGNLDERKHIEVFSVSVEAIELKDKLGPIAESNENFGYEKEGSDDIVDLSEGSVEDVTPASVFSALEHIFKEYNVEGQATVSGAIVEMYVAEEVSDYAKSLVANKEKPKLEGEEGKEIGSRGRDGSELDEAREVEVSIVSIGFVEPEACAMVENDSSIEKVGLASEDNMLVDCPEKKQSDESQITESGVQEEVHVVVELEVIDKVPNDTDSDMSNEEKPEPQGEKSEEIGSIGGNGGKLDECKDIEAIELKDKLGPLVETNEKFSYEKEGSDDMVDVNEGSVEEVTPASVFSALEDIFKKESNAEDQTTTSDAKEDVCTIAETPVAENMLDYAKSQLATEEKSKLEGVEGKKIGSRGRDGAKLDEEGEVKVSGVSIAFVEPEAGAMVENDRSTEEVALANEDVVLVDCPRMKQSDKSQITKIELHEELHVVVEPEVINMVHNDTYSYMVDEEMPEPQGEKSEEIGSMGGNGGKLDQGKDIEVISISIEATELKDQLGPLDETNEKFGYEKEGSYDIVDVNEGSVEEVTPSSVFGALTDIFKKEYNAESRTTTSDAEDVCAIPETSVAENMPDDAKSLLAIEEKSKLEGVEGKKIGSRGRDGAKLDEEGDVKVSVVNIVFVEPEASAMVENDRSTEEVALANEEDVLVDCPEMKQSDERQITEIEVHEEEHVVVEPEVINKVHNDTYSYMADEEMPEPQGEKSEEIWSVDRNGGELDEGKDNEVISVSIEAIELKDQLGPLAETIEKIGYEKEGSGDIVEVNGGSVEEVTPASVFSTLEDIYKKEYNAKGQTTMSDAKEDVCTIAETFVAENMPDYAKSLLPMEDKSKLECVEGKKIGSRGRDGAELDEEGEVKVSVVSIVVVEPEAGAMVENDRSTEEVALPNEDDVLVDCPEMKQGDESQITEIEVHEEVNVVVEPEVLNMVHNDTYSYMADEEIPEPQGEKSEEIGSIGGNDGELDERKDIEVISVRVEAIELNDKLGPLAEANEKIGYEKEGSNDILDVNEGSVAEVTQEFVYSVLDGAFKKDHNAESQATTSDGEGEVGVLVGMYVPDKVSNDAKSLLVQEEEPKQEGVKGENGDSRVWDGVELGEEKEVEVSVGGFVFVEQETCAMVVNDRNKKEVSLACEDIVLMGRLEKKQNIESHMVEEEKAKAEGEKGEEIGFVGGNGGELDEEKDVEVFTVIDEVTELEDNLAHLSGTNEEVGYVKEESDDIVVMDEGSVERVTLESSYYMLEEISKKENSVEGQATTSEAEDIGVVVEMYVTSNVPDDVKSLIAKEENPNLEGLKVEKVGYVGRGGGGLDEKEDEVFVASVVFFEPDGKVASYSEANGDMGFEKKESDDRVVAGQEEAPKESMDKDINVEEEATNLKLSSEAITVVMDDETGDEVAPSSAYRIVESSSNKEHNVEGQENASEAREEVCVVMEAEVMDKVSDDMEHVVVDEENTILEGEKGKVVGSLGGDGGELDEEKEIEVLNVRVDTPIQCVNDGSIEEIIPASANNVLKYSSMKEHNTKGHATSSEIEKEVCLVVQGKVINKELNDMESVGTEQKVELEGDKSEEVGSICGDGDESDKEKKDKVSVVNIEAIQFEHKLASIAETNFKFGYEKKIRDDIVVVGDEEVPKEPKKKDIDIEKETSNPEPSSEASTMVVNDGSLDELAPTSTDSVLECSPIKELNFEAQSIASEAMKDVGVEKPSKVENIATAVQDLGVEKSIEVKNIVGAVKDIDVEKLIKDENVKAANSDGTLSLELPPKSIKEKNDAEEIKGVTDVVHRERKFDDDIITEIVSGYEDGFGNEGNEDDDESNADTSPTLVAILESNEATKQVMKVNVEGSSIGSMSSSRNFTNSMDGKIMLDASKDDGDENGVNSTTHATVLNSENGASSDVNVIISSQDGSKILTMDRPAGLGSLAPSLRPITPNPLVSSELAAIIANPTEEMTEEERKLHDKVELIRVKFMHLVYSLGATPNEMVVTQVLYRLGLAEGIMHGRQTKQASGLNNAWKKALSLEGEGKNDLNFSCNILVLGKTGVGKSATINSIFGKEKSKTDAFNSATTSVQEIVGDVHGVKIRIIDTPGLQPSVMDQGSNSKVLAAIKKYTKKCPPDIVLYVDRLDCLNCDLNDLPLLKTITSVLGPSIWLNAIVALTHANSAPEDLNGAHMTYEVLMAQTSHIIQKSIRQATGDMNLMNPVAFAENHSSCQRNHEDQKVLPNGERWRHQILLLCYSAKILSEADSLVKLNDPNHGKLFGLSFRSLPLPFLMSSLLEPRAYPKLSTKLGGDSDIKLDDYFDLKQDNDEQENDQLPKQQNNAYFSEEVKIPPSFDCDNPTYRYHFLEPTSTFIARPVLDAHGWDHDCGYDGVSVEETLAILNMFPANVAVHITKDKKEFSIHLDSSVAAKHGENASSFACLDIQTIGHQLAYIFRGETKIKSIKKNKSTGGFLVTFLGDTVATGVKLEDKISLGKRLSLVASTGAIRAQGDTGYGANLEACLKRKANPIDQSLSTLGISLMRWRQDLALGANLQSQFSTGRGSKMELRLGLNNKLSGQIGVKTSTSEQVQIALLGLVPIAASIYRRLQPSEPSLA